MLLSKARYHDEYPSLLETVYNINQHPSNKDVFNTVYNSGNVVEVRTRYINESNYDLSIIQANGFTLDVPRSNIPRNRLLIAFTVQWGADCEVNMAALQKHIPNVTVELLNDIHNNIKNVAFDYGSKAITFYYPVDLEGFTGSPNGVYVKDLNVQIVPTEWADQITKFSKGDSYYNDAAETEGFIPGSVIGINYYTDTPNNKEPLYMFFGNDAILIKPTYVPYCKPGVSIKLNGNAVFAAGNQHTREIFITPENFNLYGIYNSTMELIEIIKRNRNNPKEQVDRIINVYEKYHKPLDERRKTIKDIYVTENITLGDVIEFIQELGKVEAVVSKVFK